MASKISSISVTQVPQALRIVYSDRRYVIAALAVGSAIAVLLGMAVHMVTYTPKGVLSGI